MTSLAEVTVDVAPNVDRLAKVARIIEKHMGALAADLEALGDTAGRPGHVPGARPPRY